MGIQDQFAAREGMPTQMLRLPLQVLRADEVVGILVGAPEPANGNAADGGDETDDDLEPDDASGGAPCLPKQAAGRMESCAGNGQKNRSLARPSLF